VPWRAICFFPPHIFHSCLLNYLFYSFHRLYFSIPTQYVIFDFSGLFILFSSYLHILYFVPDCTQLVFSFVVRPMPDNNLHMEQGPHYLHPHSTSQGTFNSKWPPTHQPVADFLSSRDRTTWFQAPEIHPT
jgi:hypothetical protein